MTTSSSATRPGFRKGQHPPNYGKTYPAEGLTQDEVRALLRATYDTGDTGVRNHALIMILYRCGLRISEALDLQIKDIDFPNHAVNVLRGKGNKRRTVGIDDSGIRAIQEWIAVRKAPAGAPLFCTLKGTRLYASYVRGLLGRLGVKAEINKRIHPHMFRHTFAAELAREGVPMHIIQRQLGHTSLATTTRYLSTIAPQEVIDTISARSLGWDIKEKSADENSV